MSSLRRHTERDLFLRIGDLQKKKEQERTHGAANYRPISLTCIASTLFEHIVTSNLVGHPGNHGILYEKQHGFRKGRSCESQLREFTHDLLNGLHDGKHTDLIVMDFAKAFTKVCHEKLLTTVHSYSVDPPPSIGSEAS